jgi:radical SAM protein with 4Fe4S-binding SPASM domain
MQCKEKWKSDLDFIREFNQKTERLRVPISGSIDLTHRCNLRCVHCYLAGNFERHIDNYNEMSPSRILALIDEITEAGCLYLLITGGEPLLRKDFPEIYSHAKKRGLVITVFTNGTLITDRVLDLFEDMPPQLVEISIYGATASTYEKITGVPGSYEKCLNAITKLVERKIPVGLKTILMTVNRNEFFAMEDIAKNFGVKFRFDAAIFPRINGDKSPIGLRVPAAEAIEKEFSDAERARQWVKYFQRSQDNLPNNKLFNCGAGLTGFHIDSYGNLQPCIMTNYIQHDLSTDSFLSGWYGIISGIRDKKTSNLAGCNKCEISHLCGFCPAFFKWETGAEEIYSEYLCSMGSCRLQHINKCIG